VVSTTSSPIVAKVEIYLQQEHKELVKGGLMWISMSVLRMMATILKNKQLIRMTKTTKTKKKKMRRTQIVNITIISRISSRVKDQVVQLSMHRLSNKMLKGINNKGPM
jgi:hypothetical protein